MTVVRNPACLWGGLGVLVALGALPFVAREAQFLALFGLGGSLTGLSLAGRLPWFWLAIGLGVVWVAVGLTPQRRPDRAALWGGLLGCVLISWLTFTVAVRPYAFGPGALLALTVCLIVLAYGLSQGGFIRADTFVSSSILLLGFFVLLFVIYPILAVLQHSVMDAKGFRPALFLETLLNYKSFWRVL